MTDHDVFRMAKEASGLDQLCAVHGFLDALVEFARMVAAHEREACATACEGFDGYAAATIRAKGGV